MHEDKQNKTQMQYQGPYPKEAAELEEEYDQKVANIDSNDEKEEEGGGRGP